MHKLEAVIVSFNCLDLLSITLPRNLPEFDTITIITKPDDKATLDYCQSLNDSKLRVLVTDVFTQNGCQFNKGEAINQGIDVTLYKEFIALMDCDVIVPKGFKKKFNEIILDKECLYGMRRLNLDTKQDLEDLESGKKQKDDFTLFRGAFYGYFQLFHYQSSTFQRLLKQFNGKAYPFWIPVANDIDWVFYLHFGEMIYDPPLGKFPECHFEPNQDYSTGKLRELQFHCIHLGTPGLNHIERTTPSFS